MIREVGLRRNSESPTLPSGFNCCAEGLGISVFTQPGSKAEVLIEYPAVDYQLETAALVLRVQLLQKLGFGILPKVKLGDGKLPSRQPTVVTN